MGGGRVKNVQKKSDIIFFQFYFNSFSILCQVYFNSFSILCQFYFNGEAMATLLSATYFIYNDWYVFLSGNLLTIIVIFWIEKGPSTIPGANYGSYFLCWILGVVPFNMWLISSWEENNCCYKLSYWQSDNFDHFEWNRCHFLPSHIWGLRLKTFQSGSKIFTYGSIMFALRVWVGFGSSWKGGPLHENCSFLSISTWFQLHD